MLERLNQAMEHIEDHLDQRIEAADLARIAVTSEYHLRRLFSALAGIPLSEYIRRRRLTVAGAEVLTGERTLLEIAVRYGYTSGEAFARVPCDARRRSGRGQAHRRDAALPATDVLPPRRRREQQHAVQGRGEGGVPCGRQEGARPPRARG